MRRRTTFSRRSARARGFSLIELLVALVVVVEILIAAGLLLDLNTRMTRIQSGLATMQQSLRVAQGDIERTVRMAGRGGLPHGLDYNPPGGSLELNGFAIHVRDNVGVGASPLSREAAIGYAGSPLAVAGTDILTVRGCIESPLYQIRTGDFTPDLNGDGTRDDGRIFVRNPGPANLCQDLTTLTQAVGRPLLLASPLYEPEIVRSAAGRATRPILVARITAVNGAAGITNLCDVDAPEQIEVRLDLTAASDPYLRLFNADVYPTTFANAAWACVLEEHRFFIREEYAIPGDANSELLPRLTRAAMDPGRERPLGATAAEREANLRLDVADDIADLQVALGFDSAYQGSFDDDMNFTGADDEVVEGADAASRVNDDWLFNSAGDSLTNVAWGFDTSLAGRTRKLEYVRVSLLGRVARPDSHFRARPLVRIEDADFTQPPFNQANSANALLFRRRVLQTVIDPRNL